jgi:type IV pilus assembly protein PilW
MRLRSEGFSLIELMVAMALGVLLLSGVLAVFLSSRSTHETTDRLSRVQDNGRFALDSIVRDIRAAGYLGCSRRAPLTISLGSPDTLQWDFSQALHAFDAEESSWSPGFDQQVLVTDVASEPTFGSDVLVVHMPRADFVEPVRVLKGSLMTATTDDIQTEDTSESLLRAGDIVQISDCNARSIFQVEANTAGIIAHGKVAPDYEKNLPGNSTADLDWAYTDTAELVALQSAVYYVSTASSTAGGTSLWRRSSGNGAPEELAEGVENLQFLFGVADGSDFVYRSADEITDWSQVKSVSIALLVRSTSQYGTDPDNGSYQLLDETITAPGDRHLRQVFMTTVGIRNDPS